MGSPRELEMVDPQLIERVRSGRYVVDPHAVAGAIIARRHKSAHISRVLVTAELDGAAADPGEDSSGALADLA